MATTRARATLQEIGEIVHDNPLGALFAFTHKDDAYSPQMLLVYDDFAESVLENAVPLHQVEVSGAFEGPDAPENEPLLLESLLVFSTPTLLWITPPGENKMGHLVAANGQSVEVVMRHVGTVMLRKLEADAIEVIAKLNS